jgi:hypothetical protein
VIGFKHGALTHVVQPGRTGLLVSSVEEMARAINDCYAIDPSHCREVAKARFCHLRMIQQYFDRYQYLTKLSGSGVRSNA